MKTSSEKFAMSIRVLSVPPVMAAVFLSILFLARADIVMTSEQLWVALGCIAFAPLLAYPISWVAHTGREGQRSLAMYLSFAGYLGAYIYSLAALAPNNYQFICGTYVFSVILLLVFNKLLHLRSSGHACSVSGPIVLLCYFLGWRVVPICAAVYALVFWASVKTKRHTVSEFLLGSLCVILAGVLSYVCLNVL